MRIYSVVPFEHAVVSSKIAFSTETWLEC